MDYVAEYIQKIESGEINACKKIKKCYLKIIKPCIEGKHQKYYYDEEEGEKFIKFAETYCKQSKGKWAGKTTELALYQKAKYQAFFGILERETGRRRFKEIFDVRGRKNGKSTENSMLALYLTLKEKGGELYVAATVASQARRVWEESQTMIDQNRILMKRLDYKVFPSPQIYTKKTKKHPITSVYKVLSKNVKTFDGLNASGAIIDEVHELARNIYDILKQSMSTRDEPVLSMITTAGFVREGLFDDLYKYASDVLDGIVEDDRLFPLIYELDSTKEITDEAAWVKANPGIDIMKNREDLRYNVNRMSADKNFANTVKVKDFNIIGLEAKSWLEYEEFNNEIEYSEEEIQQFDNSIVLGGFDLSRTGDMTAFCTLIPDKENKRIITIQQYWVTANFLKRQLEPEPGQMRSRVPWQAWIDRGLVRISGTDAIDYHDIANYVAGNFQQHGWMYQYINYDSYSARYLIEELAAMGYSKEGCLIATPQGFKTLSIPMQTVAEHLKAKKLCYQNNPVTKWCFSNVEMVMDRNGNEMPKKAGDNQGRKIDGVATILNCYVSLCNNMSYYMDE